MRNQGNTVSEVMSADSSTLYGHFKQHFSERQSYTYLVMLESLRSLYPGRSIITTNGEETDPINFARAGFAKAKLVGNDSVKNFVYVPEVNRLTAGDGCVAEEVRFGQYDYTYQEVTSTIYRIGWPEGYCITTTIFYIDPTGETERDAWAKSIIKAAGKWAGELHDELYVFDDSMWDKSETLWQAVKTASWDDVILDPVMKDTLIKDVEGFFDSRAVYEEYAVPWKRGIIIHGTPGCGKTISIKALMKTMLDKGVVSLYVKSFAGDQGYWSNNAIHSVFSHARQMAPCILIFEDLDSLVVDTVRSYFLNEVDGLESNHGILMIGSTNHLERLDAGISKRPSRFDRKYHFKLPGEKERILYCEYWRKKLKNNDKLDFSDEICQLVAQFTEGFSFAYLKELFVQTLLAIVGGRIEEEDDEIEIAITDAAKNDAVEEGGKSGDSEAQAEEKAAVPEKKKSPRPQMPDIPIPTHLEANPLVRVLHRQIKTLWKDMDNTDDEDDGKPNNPDGPALLPL